MFNWRHFMFFAKKAVTDENNKPVISELNVTCVTRGNGKVVLGDAEGYVNIMQRDFSLAHFRAYNCTLSHAKMVAKRNILLTIGEDESDNICPTLKVWNLDTIDNPRCQRTVKITPGKGGGVPVICMAALDDLSQVAVGLSNGAVVLVRGSDISRDRFTKTKVIPPTEPTVVTGLGWTKAHGNTILFVITLDAITTYTTNLKDQKEVLDTQGCDIGASVMSDTGDLVLGRPEAVYFYEPDGRGPCFAFQGEKKLVFWFRSYLGIVSRDPNGSNNPDKLDIYDLKNKFVAFSASFLDIRHVTSEWGSLFVFTGDRKAFQLEEKDMERKLDMLFMKNLYPVAISLGKSTENYDLADIYRKYGDHLYSKGDYGRAIDQYLHTIGRLEPSYVIRKFLDAQRIHNLTLYLQALHTKGLANADHTTLLLNCYTKLNNGPKLKEFIETDDVNFDVETAIKVCRSAQQFEHALYLARRYNEHDWFLKIQLEDIGSQDTAGYVEALNYIETLEFSEAEQNLNKYGKALVTRLPQRTTRLLMRLCKGYDADPPAEAALERPPPAQDVSDDELDVRSALFGGGGGGRRNSDDVFAFTSSRRQALPEEFIHIFVDQQAWLIVFLEYIVREKINNSPSIFSTLLELYLTDEEVVSAEAAAAMAEGDAATKAMRLLTDPASNFDLEEALVLCKLHDFRPGVLHLYEQLALYDEVVQFYMDSGDYPNILRSCHKYGKERADLWVKVLSYFASKTDAKAEVAEVLDAVDRNNLMPPLLVVQILAQNPTATLSTVREYITRRVQDEKEMAQKDQRTIIRFMEETETMRQEIEELKTKAKTFQENRCASCKSPLDLPSVHFLCMHSFHVRCLGDSEEECIVCAPANHNVLGKVRSLEEKANEHDEFFKRLEGSADGFSIVSEYFGRGIFRQTGKGASQGPSHSERDMLFG